MTNRELIIQLLSLPLDSPVWVEVGGDGAVHRDLLDNVRSEGTMMVVVSGEPQ